MRGEGLVQGGRSCGEGLGGKGGRGNKSSSIKEGKPLTSSNIVSLLKYTSSEV